MRHGKLKLFRRQRVENRCKVCGGPIPRGRHYTCSIGCLIKSQGGK